MKTCFLIEEKTVQKIILSCFYSIKGIAVQKMRRKTFVQTENLAWTPTFILGGLVMDVFQVSFLWSLTKVLNMKGLDLT